MASSRCRLRLSFSAWGREEEEEDEDEGGFEEKAAARLSASLRLRRRAVLHILREHLWFNRMNSSDLSASQPLVSSMKCIHMMLKLTSECDLLG